eukprot:1110112-Pelagomonas_calceolata.AAC.1
MRPNGKRRSLFLSLNWKGSMPHSHRMLQDGVVDFTPRRCRKTFKGFTRGLQWWPTARDSG